MANSSNVAIAKPRTPAAGVIFFAPIGSVTVPTDGVTPLDEGFRDPGYLNQDGVTNTIDQDWSDIIAFGGDRVLTVRTSRSESFQFGLIETNAESLALAYGSTNVTMDEATGNITVQHNAKTTPELVVVAEVALRGDRIKRIVIPRGQVTDIEDVQYQDGSDEPVAYTPTIAALPDAAGNTAYEYIVSVSTTPTAVRLTAQDGRGDAPTTVDVGKAVTFGVAATFADGTTSPVTDGVTLASSDTGKATVSGLTATGKAAGTTQITATLDGVTSAPVTLAVNAPGDGK